MTREPSRAPSQRQLRVGEEVRHALAWILERRELRDPLLNELAVTVTEVQMSADLRHARVFLTPLGGRKADAVVAALDRAKGFLRHQVGQQVRLRFLPDFTFCIDDSFARAGEIERLLRDPRVRRDLESAHATELAGDGNEDGTE